MLPWLSPATIRDKRRVEHSSNDLAEQTRAGTGGDITCLLPSAKAGGGNLATVTSPFCRVLALGRCAARGCQGHGPVAGGRLEVVLGIALTGLPVPQHHPTPAKECCCSAAEQQEEKARAALHGIAASTTAGAMRVTEM